ncbi:MAG: deoxyribose-phosphate aldolase [Bacillota bacterium]
MTKNELALIIDHTLLRPEATEKDILNLCREAVEHRFGTVCINPGFVALAARELAGTGIKVCTVIGFPLGATTTGVKVFEAAGAVASGADELDMVINIGALRGGDISLVRQDIDAVVQASAGRLVKVIIEAVLLNFKEKVQACQLAAESGAGFVKTSTGFGPGGATVEDVALMRQTVGPGMGLKAAGGIRDFPMAFRMLEAGANRLGTSSGAVILKQAIAQGLI